jgi:hypothetical protein
VWHLPGQQSQTGSGRILILALMWLRRSASCADDPSIDLLPTPVTLPQRSGLGHPASRARRSSGSARPQMAADDHLPIPAALCSRQSGDTSTRPDPQATQTKRRAPAMAEKGVSGARPIAAKWMAVDRRHIGLRHVTQAPETPWD